jgi:hypothetical protein
MRVVRQTTRQKYAEINRRFNELMVRNTNGFHPNVDEVCISLANQFFVSTYTVDRALKTRLEKTA